MPPSLSANTFWLGGPTLSTLPTVTSTLPSLGPEPRLECHSYKMRASHAATMVQATGQHLCCKGDGPEQGGSHFLQKMHVLEAGKAGGTDPLDEHGIPLARQPTAEDSFSLARFWKEHVNVVVALEDSRDHLGT